MKFLKCLERIRQKGNSRGGTRASETEKSRFSVTEIENENSLSLTVQKIYKCTLRFVKNKKIVPFPLLSRAKLICETCGKIFWGQKYIHLLSKQAPNQL